MAPSRPASRDRLLGLAVACGGLALACAGPAPPDRFYSLGPSPPAHTRAAPALEGTLEVERFRADALTRERFIVHVDRPESVQMTPYAYHLWIDTPTVMLQRHLAEHLRRTGLAQRIVTPEMNVEETWEINAWIERLVHVTGSDTVLVDIEFSLSRARGGSQLARQRYRVETPVDGSDMDAVVRAFNAAVGEVFSRLEADLVAAGA